MKSKTISQIFPSLGSGHRSVQRTLPPRNTVLCIALIAAGSSPSMAQSTWQGTAPGNWSDGTRCSNGVPSGNSATISVAAPVTLNSAVPNITTLLTSNGAQLNIQDGASLTASGLTHFGTAGTGSVLNFTGGTLTTVGGRVESATANLSGGTWNITGGYFQLTSAASVFNLSGTGHLNMANGWGMNAMAGTINQTGGTFTNGGNDLWITGGTYNLSGGTLTLTGTRDIRINNGGALRIVGSGSSVSLNRHIYISSAGNTTGRLVFALDNSAQHNTTIQSYSFNTERAVNLETELQGGVLLSGKNNFDLWQAESFLTTTGADFRSTPDHLWTTSIAHNVNGTRDAIRIELATGQLRGNLDAASMNELGFTGANHGYVTLSSVDLSQALTLGLDITGGTLSNFTDALTAANILWSEGTGDYEVNVEFDPAISGGNYFAWDFSTIDSEMQLQGLAVIPEPSPTLLVAAGLMATAMLRRRRV